VTRLDFVDERLAALEASGRRRQPREIEERHGAHVVVEGRRLINVSSNDYLGLAQHPALAAAATAAMARDGVGAGASRLITGNVALATQLEAALAALHGAPSARLFNSGYAANTGTISVLVERGDLVFSDELNHASIIDGCRLSRAEVVVYRHNDVEHLADLLASRATSGRRLVVTESLFSMDGDLAPLAAIRSLTATRDAILMVDDAHAVGALGDGRGLGWEAGADVVVGTLGKAFGSGGPYGLGPHSLAAPPRSPARPLVFSTGLPVPVLAAALEAVRIVGSPEGAALRSRLAAMVARLGAASYIIPLLVGEERRTMAAMERLLTRGLLVQGIRPPTVPVGTSRLRLSLSAGLSDEDVAELMAGLDLMESEGWFVPRGTSRR